MENQETKGLVAFYFEGCPVRKLDIEGEVWFVAKDVAEALGYTSTNMAQIFSHVPAEWKGSNPIATLGGVQNMLCLSEQGLYFFLGRSDKPAALPFQKWLAGEVVPAIRRQGFYAPPELIEWFEKYKDLPERFDKFKGQTVEAYKKLKAENEDAHRQLLENTAGKAVDEVKEYLLSVHKPSAHEAQLADLKNYLSKTIVVTQDRRDKIDQFRLYPGYKHHVSNPIPEDAFAAHLLLLYPQIKFRGGVFSGVRLDY
ncbi:MAG: hypothetical protein LBP37_04005 [Spirochaetaceae bacterium]|jgi:prophage antirepressor-like protein|nr:hypothetical protein [Spirochaetaceae bacterium]